SKLDVAWHFAGRRGQFFSLRGQVTRVAEERLPPRLAERLDLPRYYRCDCELEDERQPAVAYVLDVPMAWPLNEPLHEPVSFHGMYFKLSGGGASHPHTPGFAAARLAWHP